MYGLYWSRGSTSETSKASYTLPPQRSKAYTPVVGVHQCQGLPDYPAQLESRAEEITWKLKGRTILVISGTGGIGKTTLAKQVFNSISKTFDATCFVENVKGIPSHKLKERIADGFQLGTIKVPFDWYKVEKKNTLIIMDGVDSEDQLKVIPDMKYFGNDSCLIITTRNAGILKSYENLKEYEVDLLQEHDAKRLFCQHAFGSEDIPADCVERSPFENNINAIVRKCGGLPLTLEVLGRYLRGHEANSKAWEETRQKLERAEAIGDRDQRVWASLRVSYDALSEEEKEMFSDAATFFFERPLDKALVAWSTASANHETNWVNLMSRSLVKEVWSGSRYEVWVHDQLRDLVKSIEESNMVSGSGDEAKVLVDMLNGNQVNARTTSLRLSYDAKDSQSPLLQSDSLIKLKGLKSIELDRIPLASMVNHVNEMDHNLAVLNLQDCDIPKDFAQALGNFSNLRILSLRRLKGLSYLPESFGNLTRLTHLEIACAGDLKLPESVGKLSALEYLTLTGVSYMSEKPESAGDLSSLPESLGDLSSLLTLEISNMESLTALPDSFGRNFRSLKLLTICNCRQLRVLPDSFGLGLPCLEDIYITHSPQLRRLPESFSKLSRLRRLVANMCSSLEELAESFGNLSALRRLELCNTGIRRFPACFGLLSSLEELTMTGTELENLPENFGQLKGLRELYIRDDKLNTLPDSFCSLTSLRKLHLDCEELKDLPERIGELTQLETFDLDARRLKALPPSMTNLSSLHTLKLRVSGAELNRETLKYPRDRSALSIRSPDLKMVPETLWKLASEDESLGHLLPVTFLTIECENLQKLPGKLGSELPSLQYFMLTAKSLQTLPESIGQLRSLETFHMTAESLESLPESIGHLGSLKLLNLVTPSLKSVPETVAQLSSLQELRFNCDGHEEQMPNGFQDFPFGQLKLWLSGGKIQLLPPSLCGFLTSLKDLKLQFMDKLRELPEEIGLLTSLEKLEIGFCDRMKTLPDSLGQIYSLKSVYLEVCMGLKTLPDSLGRPTSPPFQGDISDDLHAGLNGLVSLCEQSLLSLLIHLMNFCGLFQTKKKSDNLRQTEEEEESTHTTTIKATEGIRLKIGYCPSLYASLRKMGWVLIPGGDFMTYERKLIDQGAEETDPEDNGGLANLEMRSNANIILGMEHNEDAIVEMRSSEDANIELEDVDDYDYDYDYDDEEVEVEVEVEKDDDDHEDADDDEEVEVCRC